MKAPRRIGSATAIAVAAATCALAMGASGCGDLEPDQVTAEHAALRSGADLPAARPVAAAAATVLAPSTRFYVRPPHPGAVRHILDLARAGRVRDALRIVALQATPEAVWFAGGTPDEVEQAVRDTMAAAARARQIPVLAAYNLPFRDCAQYSAGGAIDSAAYRAWIDGFARGIGARGKAVVILEPDGLGIIPYNTTIYGTDDWCRPTVTDAAGNTVPAPGASSAERYAQLNHAVASLAARAPGAAVFLDGTHSAWLGVGDAAFRLVQAGVAGAAGFFLNVSNYQPTAQLLQFGTWVSACITAATAGAPWAAGHFDWCPTQYNPATGFALDYSEAYAATVTAGLAQLMDGAAATTRFVLDTGRNGQGPWQPDPAAGYPDPQYWCNAPGRGAGARPSAHTASPLHAANLWIKPPGESDGSCNRGIAGSTTDPEWGGIVDPPASQWFPPQALQLARLANPPLL